MPMIQANDKDVVPVKITEAWVEMMQTRDDEKLVVKVSGETEDGQHGTAVLWMTDDIMRGQTESDLTRNLKLLSGYGMTDGNIRNLHEIEGKDALFYCSIKDDGNGKSRTNFYLKPFVAKVALDKAAEMIEAIRGKVKAVEAEVAGTPIDDSDNIPF